MTSSPGGTPVMERRKFAPVVHGETIGVGIAQREERGGYRLAQGKGGCAAKAVIGLEGMGAGAKATVRL